MRHAVTLILLLPAAAPAGDMAEEIRTDKLAYFLNAAFGRYGVGPGRGLVLERTGVRLRLANAPKDATQVGAYSHFSLAGDFEVSAAYEALALSKPTAGYGVSFGFAVHSGGPAGAVRVARRNGADGTECIEVIRERPKDGGGTDYEWQLFPNRSRKGAMVIRRIADRVTVAAGEQGAAPADLCSLAFCTDPVSQVRLYADSGGDEGTLDGRLFDLRIRADAINGAATPPDGSWQWTTWVLVVSCVLLTTAGLMAVLRRKAAGS